MSDEFVTELRGINQTLMDFAADQAELIAAYIETRVPDIEDWMRSNASWVDRTGDARKLLFAEVTTVASVAVLALGHGVDYGIFLETSHAGQYQIITPALDYWAPILFAEIKELISG